MLKAACELEKAFELYDVGNSSFSNDRDKLPNAIDFKVRGDLVLLSTQDWIRRERMEINMDEIEDLLNDNEVIKEMEEALRSYKRKQVIER
uniref:Zinc finger BED domain-containing protein RICESLEEPER 2 n=1 Tax=Tanacetum cinerariifolium TaxID=118510 RepID=A0A699I380_TANCI|nr:zinc finger BED domain-containing protein RICESLEEPER 2 [Tanacetum cinerariifolium]